MYPHKKTFPLAAAAFAILVAAVLVVGAAAAPDPFKGTWYATDIDGSNQTLRIGGGPGNSYHVRYYDDGATICGWTSGASGPAASANGSLSALGNELSGNLPVYCLTSPRSQYDDDFPFVFTYDPGTDTMTGLGAPEPWHH